MYIKASCNFCALMRSSVAVLISAKVATFIWRNTVFKVNNGSRM